MLLRVTQYASSLASHMINNRLPIGNIKRLSSKAEHALACLPELEKVCKMSQKGCKALLQPSVKEDWQAVSAVVFELVEMATLPNMEVMRMDLLDRRIPAGPPAERGEEQGPEDSSKEDDDDEEEDVSDWDIGAYIKRRSTKNHSIGRHVLYWLILALKGVALAAEQAAGVLAAEPV